MKKTAYFLTIAVLMLSVWFMYPKPNQTAKHDFDPYMRYYSIKHKKPPKKIRLQMPNDWFFQQRAYPNDAIPEGRALDAVKQAQEDREKVLMRKSADGLETWAQAGPTNVPGRITDMAVDPDNGIEVFKRF